MKGYYSDRSTYYKYTPNKLQIFLYKVKVFFNKRFHLLKRKLSYPPQEQIDKFFAKTDLCNNCNWAMTTFGEICEKHEKEYQELMTK